MSHPVQEASLAGSRCRHAAAAHRQRMRRDGRGSTSDRRIIGTVETGKRVECGVDYFSLAVRQIDCVGQFEWALSLVLLRLTNQVSFAFLTTRLPLGVCAVRACACTVRPWRDLDLLLPSARNGTNQHFLVGMPAVLRVSQARGRRPERRSNLQACFVRLGRHRFPIPPSLRLHAEIEWADLVNSTRTYAERSGSRCGPSPNVGTFVSREKEHVRKSLNALSVLNAKFDSLCAGRWLISFLFVTTNG